MKPPLNTMYIKLFVIACLSAVSSSFTPSTVSSNNRSSVKSAMTTNNSEGESSAKTYLYDPTERDSRYGSNVAQYLCDLHDSKATFDFCGGMMFQLVLTDALRNHLGQINDDKQQPIIFDATKRRLSDVAGERSATADNFRLFHGREIRKVPDAQGGMGFVLQLSLANGNDPDGWTPQEIEGYDGWGHDVGRTWRTGELLQQEGVTNFQSQYGPAAFTLHHRFYLHLDGSNRMWLSAEDGCEGTPAPARTKNLSNLFGVLG